jgi:hypothetical protein
LCFNCTGTRHESVGAKPLSRNVTKGITSICDKGTELMMVASAKGEVIYPVVVVLVDGIKVRALIGFQNDQLGRSINGLI